MRKSSLAISEMHLFEAIDQSQVMLFIRAFDVNGDWDQASMDVTSDFMNVDRSVEIFDDTDEEDGPRYEVYLLIFSILVVIGIIFIRWKRKTQPTI